jgi:hypothetical protein
MEITHNTTSDTIYYSSEGTDENKAYIAYIYIYISVYTHTQHILFTYILHIYIHTKYIYIYAHYFILTNTLRTVYGLCDFYMQKKSI